VISEGNNVEASAFRLLENLQVAPLWLFVIGRRGRVQVQISTPPLHHLLISFFTHIAGRRSLFLFS
jgi:hypothetical protein